MYKTVIYDELYKKQTLHFPNEGSSVHSQDDGHVNWLKNVQSDYKSCFPDTDIKVTIDEFDGIMPVSMLITMKKKGHEVLKERYVKKIVHGELKRYDDLVECYLEAKGSKKLKVQSFEKEERWRMITN